MANKKKTLHQNLSFSFRASVILIRRAPPRNYVNDIKALREEHRHATQESTASCVFGALNFAVLCCMEASCFSTSAFSDHMRSDQNGRIDFMTLKKKLKCYGKELKMTHGQSYKFFLLLKCKFKDLINFTKAHFSNIYNLKSK